ncbi:MAG: hypothetical protein WD895_03740 [Acidimicrobiia bacterium]
MPSTPPTHWVSALSLVAAAAFNLPLLFWSRNAWDISSPIKPLVAATALTLVGFGLTWLLARLGIDHQAASLGVGTGLIVFVYWKAIDDLPPILLLVATVAVIAIGQRLRNMNRPGFRRGLVY